MNTDIVRKVSACFAALVGRACCTVIFLVLGMPSLGFGLTLIDNVLLRETYQFANETQWFGAPAGIALFAKKNNVIVGSQAIQRNLEQGNGQQGDNQYIQRHFCPVNQHFVHHHLKNKWRQQGK